VTLDFAYAIHSEVGDKATSALVNKRKASLLTTLKNGDIVRIVTGKDAKVHCSWNDAVRTSKAKEGIRAACNAKIKVCDDLSAINIERYLATSKNKAREFIKEHFRIISNKEVSKIEFDYCCHPKMGDEIVGFVEKNDVVIHHKLCQEAYKKMNAKKPMVFVAWADAKTARYQLIISLQNRQGILADLLSKLAKLDLNILNIELGIKSSDSAEFCKLEVETKEENSKRLEEKLSKKFKLIETISLNDAYKK
jgi:(p)ppGpp synthase/HD superfamily hydrolase